MNLKSLSKEQQQKYALLLIIGVAALFALKQFALTPLLAGHRAAKEELATLETKLEQAEAIIKRDDELTRALAESNRRLQEAARQQIPSPQNALAWANKTIFAEARSIGVDVESVSDLEVDVNGFTAKDQEKRMYKPYGVRVVTQCSFAELGRFIQSLESHNPHLSVSGFTITGQAASPERHQILLNIEWPSWKKIEMSSPFLEEAARDPA